MSSRMTAAYGLLMAICATLCADAQELASARMPVSAPAAGTPAVVEVRSLLPVSWWQVKRDPLSQAFTYNANGSLEQPGEQQLVFVPGFSIARFGSRTVMLSKPVTYRNGSIFVAREDAELIRSLTVPRTPGPRKAVAKPNRRMLIVVDPGHGGHDPGALDGTATEKASNLAISLQLKKQLEADGHTVRMTRTGDSFVELDDRVALANRIHADLFISIHANSERSGRVTGIETFHCDNDSRFDPISLGIAAAKQFSLDRLKLGLSREPTILFRTILYGLLIEDSRYRSRRLANAIQQALINETLAETRGTKPGPYRVLRQANCPAVLVEAGFMSNKVESMKLRDPAYQKKLVSGIWKGISNYIARSTAY